MSADRVQELIDDYFDRTLSDSGREALEQFLRTSDDVRRQFWSRARFHTLMRKVVLTRVGESLALEEQFPEPVAAAATPTIAPASIASSRSVGRRRTLAAIGAAALAIALIVSLRKPIVPAEATLARLERISGEVYVVEGGRQSIARSGQAITSGQGIRLVGDESAASVVFSDDTRIELDAETTVANLDFGRSPDNGGYWKQLRLAEGWLRADVPRGAAARPLTVRTPHAEVAIHGARLTVAHELEWTDVDVEEGTVQLTRPGDANRVAVEAGHFVIATEGSQPFVPTPAGFGHHKAKVRYAVPRGPIHALAVSSTGDAIVATAPSKTAGRLWKLSAKGQQKIPLKGKKSAIQSLAISGDDALKAAFRDGTVLTRSRSGGENRAKPMGTHSSARVLSPEGALLGVASSSELQIWDVAAHRLVRTVKLEGFADGPTPAVALSPNGDLVAVAGRDGIVRLWDGHTGQKRETMGGSAQGAIKALAFSPDGERLAVASEHCVRILETKRGSELRQICGHRRAVFAVAFSPDGKMLATAGQDRSVKLWDMAE